MAWDSRKNYGSSRSSSHLNLNAPVTSVPFDDFDGRFTNTSSVPFDDFNGRFSNHLPSEPISRSLTPQPNPDITYSDSTTILQHGYSKQDHQSPRTTTPIWQLLRSWAPELLASILAVCALLGIISVLRAYEGRAIDDLDLPSALTLNGLLALLGTILRAFLAVPLGSALSQEGWLGLSANSSKHPPRSRLRDLSLSDAASRGAWGSVILLFTSWRRFIAFFGALVMILCLSIDTFTQQLITSANAPITDRNSSLNPGNVPWTARYGSFQGNPAEAAFGPPLDIKAAAYNGFLANAVDDVQAKCLSGNCTFPATPSVAICGSCMPTTNTIGSCNATTCNYTTSAGTVFEMGNFNGSYLGVGFSSQSIINSRNSSTENLTVADFEVLGAPYQSLGAGLLHTVPKWPSQRCQLWMCVNIYETTVAAGEQTQNITASYSEVPNTSGGGFSGADNWTFTLPAPYNDQQYNVSALAWAALGQQLGDMVTGTAYLNLEGYSTTSDAIEAIWNGTTGDLNGWTQKLTRSLSNAIRQAAPANDTVFNGTAYRLSVVVRWAWLALPASLVLASILILIIVMVRTSSSDVGSWKGSPLTMLLFDIDEDLRQWRVEGDDVTVMGWNGFASGSDSYLAEKRVALQRGEDGVFRLRSWRGG